MTDIRPSIPAGEGAEPPQPVTLSSAPPRVERRSYRVDKFLDTSFRNLLMLCSASVMAIMLLFFYELTVQSNLSIKEFGFQFFVGQTWDPVFGDFGALPFIYGTLLSSLLALLLAVPTAVGVAVFVTELCPRFLAGPIAFLVELLAAIPSVIYGLWGIFVLAPILRLHVQPLLAEYLGWTGLFSGPPFGVGMLAAGVILAIMIVPIISSITREVLRAVPQNQREAALALGATKWEMVRMAVLRNARAGIMGSIILGLGRAVGETMAVTMVIGNRPEISKSLFAPGYSMASVIANEFAEATGDLYLSALMEIGLALLIVTVIINILARILIWSITRGVPVRSNA
jgi:phosphate transport system permease protein